MSHVLPAHLLFLHPRRTARRSGQVVARALSSGPSPPRHLPQGGSSPRTSSRPWGPPSWTPPAPRCSRCQSGTLPSGAPDPSGPHSRCPPTLTHLHFWAREDPRGSVASVSPGLCHLLRHPSLTMPFSQGTTVGTFHISCLVFKDSLMRACGTALEPFEGVTSMVRPPSPAPSTSGVAIVRPSPRQGSRALCCVQGLPGQRPRAGGSAQREAMPHGLEAGRPRSRCGEDGFRAWPLCLGGAPVSWGHGPTPPGPPWRPPVGPSLSQAIFL